MKIYLLTFIVFILILGNFYFILVRFAERFDRIMGPFMGIILIIYFENYRNREFLVFSSWVLLVFLIFQIMVYAKSNKKVSSAPKNSNRRNSKVNNLTTKNCHSNKYYSKTNYINPKMSDFSKDMNVELENYSRKISINPHNVDLYLEHSRIAESLGKYHIGIQDLTTAIKLNPENSHFYYFRRHLFYKKLNNYKEALSDILQAVELSPKGFSYINRLIEIYHDLGDYDKAVEILSLNINKDICNTHAYIDRFNYLKKIGQYYEALLDINKVIEMNPTILNYYHERVRLFVKMKEFPKAMDDCNYCITKEPNYWLNHSVLSEVYKAIGDKELASKHDSISRDLYPPIYR